MIQECMLPNSKNPMQEEGEGVLKTKTLVLLHGLGVRLGSKLYSLGGCTDTGAAARDRRAPRCCGTGASASTPGGIPTQTWGCFGAASAGTRETAA